MTVPPPSMVGGVERAEFLFAIAPPPDIKEGGNFTCIATNEVGTTVRSVEIIVQRKWCCAEFLRLDAYIHFSMFQISVPEHPATGTVP